MFNLTRLAIERPLYVWLLMAFCLFGGWWGIETVGRLENPDFPIKTAFIVTEYPGASALEVEQEISEPIEAALQELPYGDVIISKSVPGRSEVQIDMHERYGPEDIPQIWDELRRRVGEAADNLPPGTKPPIIEDDYGDVYGILFAITTPGYDVADQQDVARLITTELKRIPGVAKVNTAGLPIEAVFVEMPQRRLSRLGLPLDAVLAAVANENRVQVSGSLKHGSRRLRIAPPLAFDDLSAISDMRIGVPGTTEILRLGDIATISREPVENQPHRIRYNGEPAFSLGVSISKGGNVVEIGKAVDAALAEAMGQIPVGIEAHRVYSQHIAVEAAISDFLQNLLLSVTTVFAALFLFMGWRAGIVVGCVLLLTVMGSIGLMALLDIELQRISLGALMIAMGMLVDNAIVVAEGMVVGMQLGRSPLAAATQAVARTRWPLLAATAIGVLAFAPIGLSDDNSGYFLRSLFQVVCIALFLSWVLAITVVPLLGSYLLRSPTGSEEATLYNGWAYRPYQILLGLGLRHAWLATLAIIAVTGLCFYVGQFMKTGFFPGTNTPLVFVDLQFAQGTDIESTDQQTLAAEALLQDQPGVANISSYVGRGVSRFSGVARPQQPNPAYAQLLVEVTDTELIPEVIASVRETLNNALPQAMVLVRREEFSPSGSFRIEARFSGPDITVLRSLTEQALDVFLKQQLFNRSVDWQQPEIELVPKFDSVRARLAGISRGDVAQSFAYNTDGVPAGLFRDADKVVPILMRAPLRERANISALKDRLVWSPSEQTYVPISQVLTHLDTTATENLIWRRDRVRMMTAQANPPPGHNPTAVFNRIRADIEAIKLPPGYRLEWGGEHESSEEARRSLLGKVPGTFGGMFILTLLLFGHLRQAIIIWLTVPMCACGLILVLVATDLTLTFPGILGFLSLIGMLIKNCIVLVDEIDKQFQEKAMNLEVMLAASLSRLRPVVLAAGTTIAGMAPLLTDAFFKEMAVGIMGGLAFATLITLLALPVFYRIALGRTLTNSARPD